MFSSQTGLFGKTRGSQDGYPTECPGDFSQLQHANCSQFELFSENSQDNSQMFYSQNEENSGSNSESYRQIPVYEKYLAKPSLFGNRSTRGRGESQGRLNKNLVYNSSNNMKAPGPSGQQNSSQHIALQKAKAKERDERDLLGSIVKMVKECADEVKCSLDTFKESENGKIDDLQGSVKELVSSFEQNSNKILKAVESTGDHFEKIHSLERAIQKKDEEIHKLNEQKTQSSIEESCALVLDKMKNFISEQQHHMEQKLEHIVETTQEQLTLVKDLNQNKKMGLEEGTKNFQDMKYSNQRQLHDIEKRLTDEIVQIRDDFDRQKRDMENFYRNQMQAFHQKQTRDLEQYLKRGMENAMQKSEGLTAQDIKECQTEIMSKNQSQYKQMESHIKATNKQQSDFLLKQCQQSLKKHQSSIEQSMKDNYNSLKNQQNEFIELSNTTLKQIHDASKMRWENDNVPKHIQEQLNTLHRNHQSEIKRLESEIREQKEKAEEGAVKRNVSQRGPYSNVGNVYNPDRDDTDLKQSGSTSMFEKRIGFLSPKPLQGTRWNSRTLFGRTNPSPVATVLPQRKPIMGKVTARTVELAAYRSPSVQRESLQELSGTAVNTQTLEEGPKSDGRSNPKTTQGSRKRKRTGYRKRRPKKGRQTRNENTAVKSTDISAPVPNCDSLGQTTTQFEEDENNNGTSNETSTIKSSVYEFHDDEPVLSKWQSVRQSDQVLNLTQESNASSHSNNGGSAESSPSLSVTEVFITRKVHSGTSDNTGVPGDNNFGGNFFSSPSTGMIEMFKHTDSSIGVLKPQNKIPRIKERRKLCDLDTHTQVFQMIQCLQKSKY